MMRQDQLICLQVQNQTLTTIFISQLILPFCTSTDMALKSLVHDPYISAFLDQIPQNQHIITLKQLIYIGIKIVSNSFQSDPPTSNVLSGLENKENQTIHNVKHTMPKKSTVQYLNKPSKNDKRFKKSKNSNLHPSSNRTDKIQSTLLRQISKIRLQLESLTNKVYDHYFDENQQSQSQDSLNYGNQEENRYVQSHGFNYPQNIPTFSPAKEKRANTNSYASNPFLKQKNNFFVTQGNKKPEHQNDRGRSYQAKNPLTYPENETRNRARSNIMHLDDTQIRQALYHDNEESQTQNMIRDKAKKSHSLIQKMHQQKKKDQQNYFYQLNLDKQNVKQLQKFKEAKPQQFQVSYRDFSENVPRTIDPYKKKAKSKIKSLVQRDKQKHRMRQEEQNLKKGLDEYEYSANELDEEQDEQSNEADNYQSRQEQGESFSIEKQNLKAQTEKHQRSAQQYSQSPGQNKRERNISNPNFGFYDSKQQSEQASRRQNTFNNNQSVPDENVNVREDESSFSQFSEFSMSSSSRREVGKISRRRQQ